MAADLYCSRGDVNERIQGGITFEGRLVSAVNATTDTITLDGHGFEDDTPVYVRPAEGESLPAPLVETATYYVKRVTNAKFQLAATASGAAINLTTAGGSTFVSREPPYDNVIEFVSRWADAFLPADAVPLEAPIHPLVRGVVADISAKRLQNYDGKSSAIVDAAELAGKAILERFSKGLPLREADGITTTSTNKAIVTTITDDEPDQRGWGSAGLP